MTGANATRPVGPACPQALRGVNALWDVSLDAWPGAELALLGDNGAGKSTVVKCISGIHAPDEGDILLHGRPVTLPSPSAARAIAVARVTTFARNIILLDEPTSALGLREARKVLDLIARLRAEGNAVIPITHNMDHVTELADRAVVLRQGRKVGDLKPDQSSRQGLVSLIVGGET